MRRLIPLHPLVIAAWRLEKRLARAKGQTNQGQVEHPVLQDRDERAFSSLPIVVSKSGSAPKGLMVSGCPNLATNRMTHPFEISVSL
jgi:hypothetical protein